jgi:mRNA interferase YafQ
MRELGYSARFKRDFKRELRDPQNKNLSLLLSEFTHYLVRNLKAPMKYQVHQLSGNYIGHYEAHLKPDLLIIYIFEGTESVILIRLGSHSDLF